ncbi:hypothetical protein VP478_001785 [Campylobacter jejuni]|nr:hypothetical protein [Campylobacter jejuni]
MNDKTYKFHPNDTKMDKKIIQITEKSGFKAAVFSMAAMYKTALQIKVI